jgi:hypothetical protein
MRETEAAAAQVRRDLRTSGAILGHSDALLTRICRTPPHLLPGASINTVINSNAARACTAFIATKLLGALLSKEMRGKSSPEGTSTHRNVYKTCLIWPMHYQAVG